MDRFYINQICTNCWRGNQVFCVELSLYNSNGILREGMEELDHFIFICAFCWKTTRLDFYTFSHPSMILHLKRLERLHEQQVDALKKLNIAFQNSK